MLLIRAVAVACALALFGVAGVTSPLAQVVTGEEHCVVNVKASDRLNVRTEPRASGAVVTKLRYGQCGVIVTGKCAGSWCPIEDGHNAGWVNARFISMVSPAVYCVTGVGIGDGLNVRGVPQHPLQSAHGP